MNTPNLTIKQLEQLLELHKRKEALLAGLSTLDSEIAGAFSGDATPARRKAGRPKGRGPGRPAAVKTTRKTRRGGLKEMILARLQSVGPEGIKVKDLAADLGINRKNVEIWFYTTGKKVSAIKKLGPGLFTMAPNGNKAPGPARGRKPRKGSRAKAGSTKERVLGALKEAGASGISVKELSGKLGIKNQNLHTWFNQTGKKMPEITKVSLGRYRLVA